MQKSEKPTRFFLRGSNKPLPGAHQSAPSPPQSPLESLSLAGKKSQDDNQTKGVGPMLLSFTKLGTLC